jgi:predicted AlkP superfamily phosphohydrolase/phosphomutase
LAVYIIGLDGASLEMIREAAANPSLQNLSKLVNYGSSTALESVLPYVTGPAWTSLFSGVNPGRHGIFDMYFEKDGNKIIPTLPTGVPYLWDYLNWAGKRVLVMGAPFAYPAPRVNGIFVSGRFVPELSFYPRELNSKYDLSGFNYNIPGRKVKFSSNDSSERSRYAQNVLEDFERRIETSIEISKAESWDVVAVVDSLPDQLLHIVYNWTPVLNKMFILIDRWLGEFMQLMKKEDTLAIVSDHGFQDIFRTFYAREWLRQRGYVKEDSFFKQRIMKTIAYRRSKFFIDKLRDRLGLSRERPGNIVAKTKVKSRRSAVDVMGTTGDHLWIKFNTVDGKNLIKLHNDLFNHLKELKESNYIKEIYSVNELYKGDYVRNFDADILIEAGDGVSLNRKKITCGSIEHTYPKKIGGHKREGLILLYSEYLKFSLSNKQSIYDVLPTILHLMRIPAPDGLEGKRVDFQSRDTDDKVPRDTVQ